MDEAVAAIVVCLFVHMAVYMNRSRRRLEYLERADKAWEEQRQRILRRIALMDQSIEGAFRRRAQRRRVFLQLAPRAAPIVLAHKSDEWWKDVVPTFSEDQWVQNFRMSRETFEYLCGRVQPVMEKQDTHFRLGVPLQQRVAIAVRKLATNADHSSISHLFGVSRSTACKCLKAFCSAVEDVLWPKVIQFPDAAKLKEMEGRWRCLLKRNDCKTGLVRSMILTCCVLHNLCESHGEDFKGDWENPVHIDRLIQV